jgi:hypothetical protein
MTNVLTKRTTALITFAMLAVCGGLLDMTWASTSHADPLCVAEYRPDVPSKQTTPARPWSCNVTTRCGAANIVVNGRPVKRTFVEVTDRRLVDPTRPYAENGGKPGAQSNRYSSLCSCKCEPRL